MNDSLSSASQTYLSFKIGDETYAVHTQYVVSILALKPITKLPETPEYVCGIINFREHALPVFDVRIMFGLPQVEAGLETSIISTEIPSNEGVLKIGLLVDSLTGVFNIAPSEILPPPSVNKHLDNVWIEGLHSTDETFTQILKLDVLIEKFDDEWFKDVKTIVE